MTPKRVETLRRLRRLARTKTQSEAAALLGVRRQWVHELAHKYDIEFRRLPRAPKSSRCSRCSFRLDGALACLRCKWTAHKIKRLRSRYRVSQADMALEVLSMSVWSCVRWEHGWNRPSPRSLRLLEQKELALG